MIKIVGFIPMKKKKELVENDNVNGVHGKSVENFVCMRI